MSKRRLEIIIAGRGGQGILFAGHVLAQALVDEGYYVVNSEYYSAETRGGDSRSDIIVFPREEEVDVIKVVEPDIAVFMYADQAKKYGSSVPRDAHLVLLDSTYIRDPPYEWRNVVSAPFTELARATVGSDRVANVVVLGVLCYLTGLVSLETLERALKQLTPARWLDPNIRALHEGYIYAAKNMKRRPVAELLRREV